LVTVSAKLSACQWHHVKYVSPQDHVGVVRALLDANLVPRVIAGTSAGGLIAALMCTRSDEELRLLLDPRLADNMYVSSFNSGGRLIIASVRHARSPLASGGMHSFRVE
jgi:predicted acylesterase/phospholipase RssA